MTLDESINFAKKWFIDNNIDIPKGAIDWRNGSVRNGNIPPNLSYGAIIKNLDITVGNFIKLLNNEQIRKISIPITSKNISEDLGFEYLEDKQSETNHKKVFVECNNCGYREWLDYGTLSRMKKKGDKYCRVCRDVGGKKKPIEIYNRFEGFSVVKINSNSTITYNCNTCNKNIIRGMSHAKASDYLVCEHCNPNMVGAKIEDEKYGYFDSKIEYTIFEKLLQYFSSKEIERQVSYNSLFETRTKHTADFYIPKLNIIIEVTTINNGIPGYSETKQWKQSISDNIHFIHNKEELVILMNAAGVNKL